MVASPSGELDRAAHLDKFRRCSQFAVEKLPSANREQLIGLPDGSETIAYLREPSQLATP
jgi:hypothetical protein